MRAASAADDPDDDRWDERRHDATVGVKDSFVSTIIELIGALASLIAAGIAWGAWRVARQAFRRDHRPIVRVVALAQPSTMMAIREARDHDMVMDAVLLKNVGRGPALTVLAVSRTGDLLLGDVDVVEPLGVGASESERSGRVRMTLQRRITMDESYELYYQDVLSKWHRTRFRARPWRIECSFDGEVSDRSVPDTVRVFTTVAKP